MQTVLSIDELRAHDPEGGHNGRWLCPMPACADHTDPRHHRNLSLEEATGLWYCHRCHAGGQIKEKWKPMERRDWKTERRQKRDQVRRRVIEAAQSVRDKDPLPVEEGLCTFRLGNLRRLDNTPGLLYLIRRGLGPELLAGLSFAEDFGRRPAEENKPAWGGAPAVVFPIRDHHRRLVAAHGRFVTPQEGRLKALTFGPRSKGVYSTPGAWDRPDMPLAVVEAPIDALSLADVGIPAVALCGTSGLPEWLCWYLAWRPCLLAFDADDAGDKAAEHFAAELAKATLGRARVMRLRPIGAKDWNEMLMIAPAALRDIVAPYLPTPGGQVTPPITQRGLLGAPGAKQGVERLETECAAIVEIQTTPAWSEAPPAPELIALDASLPWPAVPADNPARAKQWASRTLVRMAAQGRSVADMDSFAVGFELDVAQVIARTLRQTTAKA